MDYYNKYFVLFIAFTFVLSSYSQNNFYDDRLISKEQKINYLVSFPNDYQNDSKKQHPVILFLHGGDGSNTKHHPKKYALQSGLDFPFIVIAPHAKGRISWSNLDFKSLMDEVAQSYRIDKRRIYITGYSYGGYGTWSALIKFPTLFAAAAPICGGGGDPQRICEAKSVAVKAYHAKDDNVTPYSKSAAMINALKKCKADATLKTAVIGGHGIWPSIYKDPKFYEWMLSHSK